MAKEKQKKDGERLEQIESTLGKTEMFIERNKKPIVIGVIAVIVVVLVIIGLKKFVWEPREVAAQEMLYPTQEILISDGPQQAVDSLSNAVVDKKYEIALNGDGASCGLLSIIDEYGRTKAGNLARYYAGVCYLNLGDFENAIKYLKEFESDDMFAKPLSMGLIGDAYLELGDINEAASCYEKAGMETKNITTSPYLLMKAGYAYEMVDNYSKALEMYNVIKNEYPSSTQGYHILKNIAMVEAKRASK